MTFEEWLIETQADPEGADNLRHVWDGAQKELLKGIEGLHEQIRGMQHQIGKDQTEIGLLRAVYDDSRILLNTGLDEAFDAMICSLGCVERFDEENK